MNSTTTFRIALAAIGLFSAAVCLAAGDGPRPPALPKVFLETSVASTPVTGKTIDVGPGGDFQAALNQAQPGDEIVLRAGATYTGHFILPAKQGSGKWITIRTSDMAGLPKEGTRVSPKHAAAMPKIVDPDGSGAINTALRAGYYRLIGLDVSLSPQAKLVWALVNLGAGGKEQNSFDMVAHHLVLDRMYIHGDPKHDCFRCVALNSGSSAVIDSYLSEGHANGFDAQAISGFNGPGPYKIVNNYLEGAGENVMFGGADPGIRDLVPSDIEFRSNYCFKPLSWKIGHPTYAGIPWTVKNLFELTNNIMGFGQYGPGVDGGQNTFAEAFPGGIFAKNLVVGHGEGRAEHAAKAKNFPAGFLFETKHVGGSPQHDADWPAVGFVDYAGGDYRLSGTSKYRAIGSDGKPLGADIDAIEAAVRKATGP